MLAYYFVVVLSCLVFVDAGTVFKGRHLPSYVVACKRNSPDLNECATEHGKKAIPEILKGDKKYKIPVLVPLHLEKIEIRPGDNFELILSNLDLYGLDKLDLKSVKVDPKTGYGEAVLEGSGIKILSDYTVNGQILVLPIVGEGKANINFDDCYFKFSIQYEVIKKSDGKEYANLTTSDIKYKVGKAKFHLSNLFNGNKELGENMNKVLNDNQQEVLSDLGGAISGVIKTIASGIVGSILSTIPYDEVLIP